MTTAARVPQLAAVTPGRPPAAAITVGRRCRAVTRDGTRCLSSASWLVPDVAYCGKHMPPTYLALARDRELAWVAAAAHAWADVLDAHPT